MVKFVKVFGIADTNNTKKNTQDFWCYKETNNIKENIHEASGVFTYKQII